MGVQLNHTIVAASDNEKSAQFYTEIFGFDPPTRFGHFMQVDTANGVSLDFASTDDEINHHDGGRAVYFPDPDGHFLEIITRPYGSGG